MVSTVKVHNVSLEASEQDIREFFSFSGFILHVELQSGDERSQFAYITFKDDEGSERAMLLTGATIVDMAVIITPATNYQPPAAVLADLESKNIGGVESALRKAEDAVGSMLAKGFVLGKDALEKAKSFDERHQLTSTATAKVSSLDRKMGLSQKFNTGTLVVIEKMEEMDQKYQVAEKTKSALAAAEQTVSTAGSAIMSNRYILTGAAWVTDAYSKVATTATDAGAKAKEMMVPEQDGKHQDDEPAKGHSPENSEGVQEGKHQEDEGPKSNTPENSEMGKQEMENQEGEIPTARAQENAEIAEKKYNHEEAELPKAEQTEREHKHPDSELSKTHVRGSPVTIPVCTATTDGNTSSNTPKKPEHAQGFI
ncbi:binding partner of ACD11 1-like [Oryza brachyantha]|nr:binding partner of ACD11 1-like [Oryza brachyantha]